MSSVSLHYLVKYLETFDCQWPMAWFIETLLAHPVTQPLAEQTQCLALGSFAVVSA